ncbi:hypothetical protein HZ326_28867 [Fusarium oxysporum f. sp. albedinis]|nr:putative AC9 transposase [Fusarium oxysporum f. sp. albedinis]KAJ0128037.1 hypothetical protein HZ326_28867 [Fusarium oxysporum f. sp. albedinis]
MVALSNKRETAKRDRIQQRTKACLSIKAEPLEIEYKVLPSPDRFPLLLHAATYLYILPPTVMNDHFDDQHLIRREQAERSGKKIRCEHPKCRDLKFQHVNHFRRHVQEVHGVTLRASRGLTHTLHS